MPIPNIKQLPLSKADHDRLVHRIENDWNSDSADLLNRTHAMRRWYKLWRNAMDPEGFPAEERSNFSVPLIPWTIKAKIAKEVDVLLGEESEIVVTPLGQTDAARAEKISKWMNWRVKNSLKLFKTLYHHLLQKNIFGLSIMFVPWVTKTKREKKFVTENVPQQQQIMGPGGLPVLITVPVPTVTEKELDIVTFDGPEPCVENLEDWVFPSRGKSVTDDHFTRRLWLSVDEILDLRDQGKMDATYIAECLEELKRMASQGASVPTGEVSDEKNEQSGVSQQPAGRPERVVVHNWFGKFRLNVNSDGSGGDERAQDICAFYQPTKKKLLGVCRKIDIFPDGLNHFVVSQASLDVNNVYGIGLAEQLEPISREMDALHNLAVSAGEGAIGPVIFYEPGSGYDPEKHRLEPFTAIPTTNANSVKAVNLGQIQLAPYMTLMQMNQTFAERLTALTDPQLGRQSSQPNAPRTFGQQQMLQNESNVNLLLDIRLERENLRELLHLIWEMDKRYLAKPIFFRVTESDPGDVMTDEDMQGDYDFDIGPITSISNRAQKTQELMQALALSQPMMMPPITIALLKKVLIRLGQPDVANLLPNVEAMRPPMSPEEENTRMLQGESLEPSPLDQHPVHVQSHQQLLQMLQQTQLMPGITMAMANPGAVARLQTHIIKHDAAAKQAMGMMAAAAGLFGGMGGPQQQQGEDGGDGPVPNSGQEDDGGPPNPFADAQAENASQLNSGSLNIA